MPNTNLTGIIFETWPTSEIKPLTFQSFFVTCHSISFIKKRFLARKHRISKVNIAGLNPVGALNGFFVFVTNA